MAERGPAPRAGQLARAHDSPVGKNHFKTGDHVLDLPVAGGVLTRTATSDRPSDGRQSDGLGPVADRDPMSGGKLALEVVPEGAGPDIDERSRSVNLLHAFETAAIEADTAEDRDGAAADAASPAGRGDGNAGFVAAPQHSRRLRRCRPAER